MYKHPDTGRKIEITTPALSLGSAIHNVLEPLAALPADARFKKDLRVSFEEEFSKYKGKRGGFTDTSTYGLYCNRGLEMISRVLANPEPLLQPTHVFEDDLLHGWLSKENNLIICGKIDWLTKDPATEELSIIDFKTSKEEETNSLQLSIYALLLYVLGSKQVNNLSYWYLDFADNLVDVSLPNLKQAHKDILDIGLRISEARATNLLLCPRNGCYACSPYEEIAKGNGEYVGKGKYKRDIYFVDI